MKKYAFLAAFASLAVLSPGVSAQPMPVQAENAAQALVTLRFNQRNVYFEKALYNAVSHALKVKPDARFRVTMHPSTQGGSAEANLARVTKAFTAMNIPETQVQAEMAGSIGEPYDTAYVFVQ